MADIAVVIEHPAEVADGRYILCATGELVVNQLGSGDVDVQFGVDAAVYVLQPQGLRDEIRIGQDDEILIAGTVKILVIDLSNRLCGEIGTAIVGNKLVFAVAHHLESKGGATELSLHDGRIPRVGDIPDLGLLRSARQAKLINLIDE